MMIMLKNKTNIFCNLHQAGLAIWAVFELILCYSLCKKYYVHEGEDKNMYACLCFHVRSRDTVYALQQRKGSSINDFCFLFFIL